jgi:hypothetical protein
MQPMFLHHWNTYLRHVGVGKRGHKYLTSLVTCLWVADIYQVMSLTCQIQWMLPAHPQWVCLDPSPSSRIIKYKLQLYMIRTFTWLHIWPGQTETHCTSTFLAQSHWVLLLLATFHTVMLQLCLINKGFIYLTLVFAVYFFGFTCQKSMWYGRNYDCESL